MPLTSKGKKIMKNMKDQYGSDKGEEVFYASKNKGTIKGVDKEEKDAMDLNTIIAKLAANTDLLSKPPMLTNKQKAPDMDKAEDEADLGRTAPAPKSDDSGDVSVDGSPDSNVIQKGAQAEEETGPTDEDKRKKLVNRRHILNVLKRMLQGAGAGGGLSAAGGLATGGLDVGQMLGGAGLGALLGAGYGGAEGGVKRVFGLDPLLKTVATTPASKVAGVNCYLLGMLNACRDRGIEPEKVMGPMAKVAQDLADVAVKEAADTLLAPTGKPNMLSAMGEQGMSLLDAIKAKGGELVDAAKPAVSRITSHPAYGDTAAGAGSGAMIGAGAGLALAPFLAAAAARKKKEKDEDAKGGGMGKLLTVPLLAALLGGTIGGGAGYGVNRLEAGNQVA